MVNAVGGFGQFDTSMISQMRQRFFNKLDSNGDGSIDKTEFADVFNGTSGTSADDIFSKLDANGDGSISKDELSAAMDKVDENMKKNPPPPPMGMMGGNGPSDATSSSNSTDENKNTQIFNSLDTNGDGYISLDELLAAHNESKATEIMNEADTDNDGKISKTESDAFLKSVQEKMQAASTDENSSSSSSSSLNFFDEKKLSRLIDALFGNSGSSNAVSSGDSQSADSIFSKIDSDSDGKISKSEFSVFLESLQEQTQNTNSSSDSLLSNSVSFQQDLLSSMIQAIRDYYSNYTAFGSKDSVSLYA
jgi:Ca2+-binding EF-hand superfamily protein